MLCHLFGSNKRKTVLLREWMPGCSFPLFEVAVTTLIEPDETDNRLRLWISALFFPPFHLSSGLEIGSYSDTRAGPNTCIPQLLRAQHAGVTRGIIRGKVRRRKMSSRFGELGTLAHNIRRARPDLERRLAGRSSSTHLPYDASSGDRMSARARVVRVGRVRRIIITSCLVCYSLQRISDSFREDEEPAPLRTCPSSDGEWVLPF